MSRNISKQVDKAMAEGKVPTTEQDVAILEEIFQRYPGANTQLMMLILIALQSLGAGRNSESAQSLRCAADFIESEIETAESIEARLDGKMM